MTDLIKRLREVGPDTLKDDAIATMREAADRIDYLEAENKKFKDELYQWIILARNHRE